MPLTIKESPLDGQCNRVRSIAGTQFGEDILDPRLHRLFGDVKRLTYGTVAVAQGD